MDEHLSSIEMPTHYPPSGDQQELHQPSLPSSSTPSARRDGGTTLTSANAPAPVPLYDEQDFRLTLPPERTASWSQALDWHLGHGSANSTPDPRDRVFPMRSAVSVDQPPILWSCASREHDYLHCCDSSIGGDHQASNASAELKSMRGAESLPTSSTRMGRNNPSASANVKGKGKNNLPGSITSHTSDSQLLPTFKYSSSSAGSELIDEATLLGLDDGPSLGGHGAPGEVNEPLYTKRSRHITTEEGQCVITGTDGTLQRSQDEPIHIAGVVQSFGLLVVLKEETNGRFLVHMVSENSGRILGFSPQQLFELDSFLDIFSDEQVDNILDHIDFIRDGDADVATNGPEVFNVSLRPPKGQSVKLWCAMHINSANRDFVICEFELEDDHEHPLRPANEMTPTAPGGTLYQTPTLEEFNESSETSSKPIRILRSAREKRGEVGDLQILDIMSQIQEQLASAPDLDRFLKILVGIVKELTGFRRVMLYQFDSFSNGNVVTELIDPAQTRDLYKGLQFPASDMFRQASELYKTNNVQLLYDRNLESVRLVYRTQADLEPPLDLTHSYLRAMSPQHLKYLATVGVRASMSIPIKASSKLWGLIACHSYGPRGMRVPFWMRKMFSLIGGMASRNIERLSDASRLRARKLVNTVPPDGNPSEYFITSSEDLLMLLDADFGLLSIRGKTKILGKLEQSHEALALLEYLRIKKFSSVVITQDIKAELPDLRYPPGFSIIAGMLYIPLSVGGEDFIVFFRKGQVKEVKWAGNLYENGIKAGTFDYLEPRASFQVWHETIKGKCREWSEEQVETATTLCLLNGQYVEVWRPKGAALQNSRLIRLLLSNAAHEVRTALNAIINYLEIALEGSLDQDTRDVLGKSHSASKYLIHVINDLLDLTKTEEGQDLIKDKRTAGEQH